MGHREGRPAGGSEPAGLACTELLTQANDAGGRDNITVVVVRFDG